MQPHEVIQAARNSDRIELFFLQHPGAQINGCEKRPVYTRPWSTGFSGQHGGPTLAAWTCDGPTLRLEGVLAAGNTRALLNLVPDYIHGKDIPQMGAGLMLQEGISFQFVDPDGIWDGDNLCQIVWDGTKVEAPTLMVRVASDHGRNPMPIEKFTGCSANELLCDIARELDVRISRVQGEQQKLGEDRSNA